MKDYLISDLFIKRRALSVHVFKGVIKISFKISGDGRSSQALAEFFFIYIEIKERAQLFEYFNALGVADGSGANGDDAILSVFKGMDHLGFTLTKGLFAMLFVVRAAIRSDQAISIDKGKPKMPC